MESTSFAGFDEVMLVLNAISRSAMVVFAVCESDSDDAVPE
jgi:hypothetical protein